MARSVPRPAALPDRALVGQRLRSVRKAHGLTLQQLTERSGVPLSTLSKMELGQVSVNYEKFVAVARALDVDMAALFDAAAGRRRKTRQPVVQRSTLQDAPRYDAEHYFYRALATGFPGKRMTPIHGVIAARRREDFADWVRHAGQEFVVVLSGRVQLLFETGEVVDLARHESAYFDSGVGHVYLSTSRAPAQVLVVMSAA